MSDVALAVPVATATGSPKNVKAWVDKVAYKAEVPLRVDYSSGVGTISCRESDKKNIHEVVNTMSDLQHELKGKIINTFS